MGVVWGHVEWEVEGGAAEIQNASHFKLSITKPQQSYSLPYMTSIYL